MYLINLFVNFNELLNEVKLTISQLRQRVSFVNVPWNIS